MPGTPPNLALHDRTERLLFCVCDLQVFATRNMGQMASNAEAIKQQVEEFKSVLPLVQVRTAEGHGLN
jgi:hypothetical protein